MPAITTTRELFPKATVSLAQVQAEQNLRIAAGAIRSTTDDHSDPDNFILITDWDVIGQNDDGAAPEAGTPAVGQPAAAPAAAGPSAGFASNGIFTEFNANGASARTAAQDHLAPGQDASRKMANTDKGRVTALKQRFNSAAAVTGLPPALLAAIASRESRCGNASTRMAMATEEKVLGSCRWTGAPTPQPEKAILEARRISTKQRAS